MFLNWIISSQVYNFSTIANIATLDMIHFIMILDLRFHTYFVHDTDWRVLWPAIGLEALLREPVILVQIHPTLLDEIGCRIVLNFSLNGVECPSVAFDQGWMVSMETDSEWNDTTPWHDFQCTMLTLYYTVFFSNQTANGWTTTTHKLQTPPSQCAQIHPTASTWWLNFFW